MIIGLNLVQLSGLILMYPILYTAGTNNEIDGVFVLTTKRAVHGADALIA
jgi:hypothetical protein